MISNLSIHQPEGWSLGLFGCIANTKIGNFTLENAEVEGTVMVSCVTGYAYNSEVSDVQLTEGKVDVNYTEMSSEGMYGGIVGAGFYSGEAAEAYGAPYDQPTIFVIAEEEEENAA